MKVLLVGAGAVGQVYGRHLQLGGAQVTFFVKEKYREELLDGVDMYPLNERRKGPPVRFSGYSVVSSTAEVMQRQFDQVWLCIAGPALQGPWLRDLFRSIGNATIVVFQTNPEDHELIRVAGARSQHLVYGLITMASYTAPLEGEPFTTPGTAYYVPWFLANPFSGSPERADPVVAALNKGGLKSVRRPDVPKESAFPNAMLMTYLGALEKADWSLKTLATRELQVGIDAAREAMKIVAVTNGSPPLGPKLLTTPLIVKAALWLLPMLSPFPLEAYLKKHFTKVHAQTVLALQRFKSRGAAANIATPALEVLTAERKALP